MRHLTLSSSTVSGFKKSLVRSLFALGAGVVLFVGCSKASAIGYPSSGTFLYGNTSVNAVGQTALVTSGPGFDPKGYPYRYTIPKNFNSTTKYPAIIFLHGLGETGTDDMKQVNGTANGALALISTSNPDNQTNYPCFFIAPQTTATWSDALSAVNIQKLITTFQTQYPNAFDTNRIYLTGLSEGGQGTYDLAINIALPPSLGYGTLGYNVFAALVPMSGKIISTLPPGTNASPPTSNVMDYIPNTPIWVFHGAEDTTMPITVTADAIVTYLRDNRGFSVLYTRYTNDTHGGWDTAYSHPLLLPWMMAQRLGQPRQGYPDLTINAASQGSTLSLSGTATNSPSTSTYNYSRVGWTSYNKGGNYESADNGTVGGTITNGTFTVANDVSASFSFSAADVNKTRFYVQAHSSGWGTFYNNIIGFSSAKVITLDSAACPTFNGSYPYFITVPQGAEPNPFPSSTITPTWSVSSIPLSSGSNKIQVIGELPNTGFLGLTTINMPYIISSFTSPSGDTTAPTLAITSPTSGTTYSTSTTPLAFSGTASDNVGVTSMACTNNGVSSGNPTLAGGNWSVPGGVALITGLNIVTVTATDAKSNVATCSISVTYTPPPPSSYATWKTTQFGANASNPLIAGDAADPDHDGISNLLEYALGGNPNSSSTSILPVVGSASGMLQLSFTRIVPTDVTYVVEGSNDLTNWATIATLASGGTSWTGTATVTETGSGSSRNVVVQDSTLMSSVTERFLRLRVTNP